MSYIYERDGLAAYPDDPGRTGEPEDCSLTKQQYYEDQIKVHTEQVQQQIWEVLFDLEPYVQLTSAWNPTKQVTKQDLIDYLRDELNTAEITLLIKGNIDDHARDTAHQMMNKKFAALATGRSVELATADLDSF